MEPIDQRPRLFRRSLPPAGERQHREQQEPVAAGMHAG